MNKNSIFLWGLSNRLFNLSQLARFILPTVESRSRKSVQPSAILMNLSRLQKRILKISPDIDKFKLDDITVTLNLAVITFEKRKLTKKKINELHNDVEKQNGYICISEGTGEITVIIDSNLRNLAKGIDAKKREYGNISAVGLRFSEKYVDTPGFIYAMVQQLALQNINIVEICSTYTELIFYVAQENTRLTFNTIFDRFIGK